MIDTTQKDPQDKPAPKQVSPTAMILTSTPQPIMVCRVTGEEYLPTYIEEDGIGVSVSQFKCLYLMSKPNGFTNQALSDSFLQKYMPSISLGSQSG